MAAIHDLLNRVDDKELRSKLEEEFNKLSKQKKFGLVFEEHIPECTPLYDMPVKKGSQVAKKAGNIKDIYNVLSIDDNVATCENQVTKETVEILCDELVCVAQFGEPIYPYLKPIDSVCNAPDSDLWHTLIEADNYHALQLLEYLYAGKVDCIYIDPPYNTGAKDWKYNNDYVDGSDSYRHSKWLSMMEKRLKLAKKLLNPADSVLIVTIDEKEYLHLGCLLEELFPEAKMQMVSSIISQKGVARNSSFYRTNEFIYIVQMGDSSVQPLPLSEEWMLGKKSQLSKSGIAWASLRRGSTNYLRTDRPNLFYPIIMDKDAKKIIGVGEPLLDMNSHPTSPIEEKGDVIWLWPIRQDGVECNWNLSPSKMMTCAEKGYIKIGTRHENSLFLSYLKQGNISKIENGEVNVVGYEEGSGTVIVDSSDYVRNFIPGSQWNIASHDASYLGSQLINKIFISKRFDFPKSLYAVHDTIRFFVANKPSALIVDFFAGSGTTLHAVNLLNAEDGGHRQCIMVTNNEVSEAEAKALTKQGFKPGDNEWEKLGIARYVTWARTVCSIEGHDINGNPLKGNYLGSDKPMSEGFKANAAFFKLGFLDKAAVRVGRQFREMLPTLWMKAGCHGACPTIEGTSIPEYMILPENHMAILNDSCCYAKFSEELENCSDIETVYLVTDSDADYRNMSKGLSCKNTYQLYRDYLDNFRINSRG